MGNGGQITQQPAIWNQEETDFMALATWDYGRLQDRQISDIWPAEKFPDVASYSHELQDLVKRCLNYTPDNRPTLLSARRTIDDIWNHRYTRRDSRVIGPVQPHWEREFVLGEPFPSLALPILPPTHNQRGPKG
jgi:serine/threonine protein kinase